MKRTIIAIAFVSLFYVSDALAQGRRGGHKNNRMTQDSSQTTGSRRGQMERVAEKDLPAAALSAIKNAYPNAEMKRIAKNEKGNFNVVLTETDKPRRVVVLSSTGEILKDREMPAREGKKGKKS